MKKLTLKIIISAFFSLFLPGQLFSQTGTIAGTVKDKSKSESLIGATVMIEGTSVGTTTDIDGNFKILNIKAGTYNLKVTYISYAAKTIENVKVVAGTTTNISAELEENLVSLGDITVTAVRKTNTEIAMITDIKATPFVSTGISGQQIAKTLDKDASEVVKRIPGITIQNDRFIIVRGLSERYNNVWLNNSVTPSTEADVRAFSFDIIPSAMIENIMIIKSPAAELPADFSGGFIKIATKNMPDKNSLTLSYATSFNDGTTFEKFNSYNNGSWADLLGFDNGARALPADIPSHLNLYETATNPAVRNKIAQIGQEMNNVWLPSSKTAMPEQKLLLSMNRKFNIGHRQFGNAAALTYSLSDNSDMVKIADYTIYDYINDKPAYINQFNDWQCTNTAKVGIMYNWSLLLNKNNMIEFRNLFNQSGYKRTTEREGNEWYNDGRLIRSEELRYLSRSIYTSQLAGSHSLNEPGTTKIDWIIGYSYSAKNEPDTKRYRYIQDQQNPDIFLLLFGDKADLSSVSRMWINLHENTLSTAVNFTAKPILGIMQPEIKAGLYFEDKARTFNARNFGYATASPNSSFDKTTLPVNEIFTAENINLDNGIKLMEVTALSDSYTAGNLQMAGYFSARIPVAINLNIYAGVRLERNKQTLSSYRQGTSVEVNVNRDTVNLFPSANITYNFSDKSLVRAAYGMSVNRPEFREIAPFYYVDFDMNAGVYGAPAIRQSYIHNFDIRYELYPANGETFSIGTFYKNFIHPIEQVILGNNPTQYSFENVSSAYSYGAEAEWRKSLGFIPALKDITMVMNASWIKSKVQFEAGSLSRNRPLEGQSPYIVNAGLFYQNDKGLMMSLLYNVIGRRIVAVGRPSPNQWEDIPDIYEMPRNVIDLTFSKTIGKNIEIKGGIKDILNQPVKYQQNVNTAVDMALYSQGADSGIRYFDRTQVTKLYSPGRSVMLGISLKF
jgi:outer membrane receptor for ferrienterochelin and colicin